MSLQFRDMTLDARTPVPILSKSHSAKRLLTAIVNAQPSQVMPLSNTRLAGPSALLTSFRHIALSPAYWTEGTSDGLRPIVSFRPVLMLPPERTSDASQPSEIPSLQVIPQIFCSLYHVSATGAESGQKSESLTFSKKLLHESIIRVFEEMESKAVSTVTIRTNPDIIDGLKGIEDFTLSLAQAFLQSQRSHQSSDPLSQSQTQSWRIFDSASTDSDVKAVFAQYQERGLPENKEYLGEKAWAITTLTDPIGVLDTDGRLKAALYLTVISRDLKTTIRLRSHQDFRDWTVGDGADELLTEAGVAVLKGGLSSDTLGRSILSKLQDFADASKDINTLIAGAAMGSKTGETSTLDRNTIVGELMAIDRHRDRGYMPSEFSGPLHIAPNHLLQVFNHLMDHIAATCKTQVSTRLAERGIDPTSHTVSRIGLRSLNMNHQPANLCTEALREGSEEYVSDLDGYQSSRRRSPGGYYISLRTLQNTQVT